MTSYDNDREWMAFAEYAAFESMDPKTQVGCVIVPPGHDGENPGPVYHGANRLPLGVGEHEPPHGWDQPPVKYDWISHAEEIVIARAGRHCVGATMYLPWFPCAPCARTICNAGIARLVCRTPDYTHERWGQGWIVARQLLRFRGVEVVYLEEQLKLPVEAPNAEQA